ncbi:hypothetical protein, conserved [Leishmania donovani]|uniref:Uncharacterized protein n=1 Tax=Leishmania donovani TaxID=5661 RepID=E9BMN4_LEIDO|nr:hypothetical protein, conserved [Leishmania donovani]CBZ36512.1 hypothetical protein, conserved [Leishmania donovani]
MAVYVFSLFFFFTALFSLLVSFPGHHRVCLRALSSSPKDIDALRDGVRLLSGCVGGDPPTR